MKDAVDVLNELLAAQRERAERWKAHAERLAEALVYYIDHSFDPWPEAEAKAQVALDAWRLTRG